MRKRGRVTIEDVARHAGVTSMTVSRALNRSGPVSSAVQARVEEAARELGYIPNRVAKGLRSNRTNTIALVVTDVTNPFFTTLARGAEDAASDNNNLLLLCNTDESEEEELRYIDLLTGHGVDGILFVPARTGQRARQLARDRQLPIVVLDRRVDDASVSAVRCDSKLGSREAANHLLSLGHRNVVVLAGPKGVPTSDDRALAFCEEVRAQGGQVDVLHGAYSTEWGREAAKLAIQRSPRPTAFFALNNFIAIGALQVLNEHGVSVPEEISVIGFDDLPTSMIVEPFLTVVSQPAYRMGAKAVEILLNRLNQPDSIPTEVILPTELIVRKSTAKAR